jgi:hypothetical protein
LVRIGVAAQGPEPLPYEPAYLEKDPEVFHTSKMTSQLGSLVALTSLQPRPDKRVSGKTPTYGTASLSATGPTLLPIAEATIFSRVLLY